MSEEGNVTTSILSWEQMLLSKFPAFDRAWDVGAQINWFEAFDKLMQMMIDHSKENALQCLAGTQA